MPDNGSDGGTPGRAGTVARDETVFTDDAASGGGESAGEDGGGGGEGMYEGPTEQPGEATMCAQAGAIKREIIQQQQAARRLQREFAASAGEALEARSGAGAAPAGGLPDRQSHQKEIAKG